MDFVSFEIAKKLKEKGFREKCFATYIPYGGILKLNEIDTDKIARSDLNIKDFGKCYNYYKDSNIDTPTISQVLKWLEEKHLLVIPVPSYFNAKGICISWDCDIWADDNYECCRIDKKTYEQAALAGIEYVLDNLI